MIIKIVPDSNVLIQGMMGYKSDQRKLLNLALAKKLDLYGSEETFEEFCAKVRLERMQRYWIPKIFTPEKVILDYRSFINMAEPTPIVQALEIPIRDPKDAIFIKVAKACGARIIISEDNDLLVMKKYDGIIIVTTEQFIESYLKQNNGNFY